jgi:hypothetical protein
VNTAIEVHTTGSSLFLALGRLTMFIERACKGSPRWGQHRHPAQPTKAGRMNHDGELWVLGLYVAYGWESSKAGCSKDTNQGK